MLVSLIYLVIAAKGIENIRAAIKDTNDTFYNFRSGKILNWTISIDHAIFEICHKNFIVVWNNIETALTAYGCLQNFNSG